MLKFKGILMFLFITCSFFLSSNITFGNTGTSDCILCELSLSGNTQKFDGMSKLSFHNATKDFVGFYTGLNNDFYMNSFTIEVTEDGYNKDPIKKFLETKVSSGNININYSVNPLGSHGNMDLYEINGENSINSFKYLVNGKNNINNINIYWSANTPINLYADYSGYITPLEIGRVPAGKKVYNKKVTYKYFINTITNKLYIYRMTSNSTNPINPIGTLSPTYGDMFVNKSLLLSSTSSSSLNQKITSFKVTATNDTIKLKTIYLDGNGLKGAFSNIRLVDSNMNVISTATIIAGVYGNDSAVFQNINNSSNLSNTIYVDKTAIYYIIADVNSATYKKGVSINVVTQGSNVQGSDGKDIPLTGTNVKGALHDIAQNTFKVTQVTPTTKSIKNNALEFRVNAFGKNSITLKTATIWANLSAFTQNSINTSKIKIYTKNGDFVGQVKPFVNIDDVYGIIPLKLFNTIDKNTSTTYQIRFEGLTLKPSTNEIFSVWLTDLTTSTALNAKNYPKNTETFPLISTK